jgi:hypothetical protein
VGNALAVDGTVAITNRAEKRVLYEDKVTQSLQERPLLVDTGMQKR